MTLVLFVLAFGFTLGSGLVISGYLSRRNSPVRKKVKQLAGRSDTPSVFKAAVPGSGPIKSLGYFLISAGLNIPATTFVAVPAVCGITAGLFTGAIAGLPPAAGVCAVCFAAPVIYVVVKRRRIEQQLVREMPDAIGMVVRSLQVGISVDGALREAASSLSGPLSAEIRLIYHEMALGLTFEQAFRAFEQRYARLSEVKMFVAAFVLQRETGGNLITILKSLSDTISRRFTFSRQVRTFSAEARISAMIISLLPLLFILVAWIFNPGYIARLTQTPLGRILIYTAVGFEIAGFLVMRKMTRVKI